MVEQFNQLLAFFGITGTPQNFAELVPWLVTVLACMAIFWGRSKAHVRYHAADEPLEVICGA